METHTEYDLIAELFRSGQMTIYEFRKKLDDLHWEESEIDREVRRLS